MAVVAGVEPPGQQQLGQFVVQFPLDGVPQRAGAELGLEAAPARGWCGGDGMARSAGQPRACAANGDQFLIGNT